jgi:hypothetical protein
MLTTRSESARHARAELDAIIASLQLGELAILGEFGRKLLEQADVRVRQRSCGEVNCRPARP